MDPIGGGPPTPSVLSPATSAALGEGITLVFSRWTALQMAVENGWGGRDGRRKAADFAVEVAAWFVAADPEYIYIDDLENLLHDRMGSFFETDVDDGSVEEVAEKLMIMHEECLSGDFSSVEKLRALASGGAARAAVEQSRRVASGGDEGEMSSSEDENGSEMMEMDQLKPKLPGNSSSKSVGGTAVVTDEDGWSVVGPRRLRGRK